MSIAPKLEEAASVIDQYRPLFDPQAPPDALYHEMAALHRVQEAAAIVETLGNYAEKLIRTNEDHLGWLGSTSHSSKVPIQTFIQTFSPFQP